MIADERRPRLGKKDELSAKRLGRRADDMHDLCLGCDHRLIPLPRRAKAQVAFLAIHEVAQVEAAKIVPEIATDQKEASNDDIDGTHAVAFPAADGFGVEDRRIRRQGGQAEGHAKEAPGRDPHPAGRDVERSVGEHGPAAIDPCLGMFMREVHQPVDGVFVHLGIGVEEQQPFRPGALCHDVVRPREADILVTADQLHLRKLGGDRIGGPVGRGIVEHDDMHRRIAGFYEQGPQRRQREIAGIVADHDHRQHGLRVIVGLQHDG